MVFFFFFFLFVACKDDIDLDDHEERPKDQNILAALNKQKLASKFQAFKGQLFTVRLYSFLLCNPIKFFDLPWKGI